MEMEDKDEYAVSALKCGDEDEIELKMFRFCHRSDGSNEI